MTFGRICNLDKKHFFPNNHGDYVQSKLIYQGAPEVKNSAPGIAPRCLGEMLVLWV